MLSARSAVLAHKLSPSGHHAPVGWSVTSRSGGADDTLELVRPPHTRSSTQGRKTFVNVSHVHQNQDHGNRRAPSNPASRSGPCVGRNATASSWPPSSAIGAGFGSSARISTGSLRAAVMSLVADARSSFSAGSARSRQQSVYSMFQSLHRADGHSDAAATLVARMASRFQSLHRADGHSDGS